MRPLAFAIAFALPLHAAVVGRSEPAQSLTADRVMQLPAEQRGPWLEYLQRSAAQEKADRAALAEERSAMSGGPALPQQGFSARSIPLHRPAAFYAGPEARHIGDVILSFQTPAGGWSKNLDMSGPPRARGQSYATANLAPVSSGPDDFDEPRDPQWHYVGTLDNDATTTELHFLAELSAALPGKEGDRYRASFLKGVEYLLHAQFPNGGWPQVWPLEGGYHDAITFNDDAVTESAELLQRVATHARVFSSPAAEEAASARPRNAPPMQTAPEPQSVPEDYTFVPAAVAQRAGNAAANALRCILETQVRVPGAAGGAVLTVWAQQHDALTLQPVSGRNFEPAALSSGESADVMEYLMSLPHPPPQVVLAVQAAASWFEAHRIEGYLWSGGRNTPGGRMLTTHAAAAPLWARYYSLTTGRPIFGDRDKSIHDNVMEISLERRNGYAWYGSAPAEALAQFSRWRAEHTER